MEREIPAAFSARTRFVAIILVLPALPWSQRIQPFAKAVHIDVQEIINYFTIDGDTAYVID